MVTLMLADVSVKDTLTFFILILGAVNIMGLDEEAVLKKKWGRDELENKSSSTLKSILSHLTTMYDKQLNTCFTHFELFFFLGKILRIVWKYMMGNKLSIENLSSSFYSFHFNVLKERIVIRNNNNDKKYVNTRYYNYERIIYTLTI